MKEGVKYVVNSVLPGALSNIMNCKEYDLQEAVVFNNDNLCVKDRIIYAPIYMVMFIEKKNEVPTYYKVDLSGIV